MRRLLGITFGVVASFAVPFLSAAAEAPGLIALTVIEPGQWSLRSRADPSENRSICVTDPRILLQFHHSGASCGRYVITNDPTIASVQYSCGAAGSGRTTVRVETPRLVQIDSQGIANREPFSVQLEGRRIGPCGAPFSGVRR